MEKFSATLQRDLLALVVHDADAAQLIRDVLPIELLDSPALQRIALAAYSFIDSYRRPPGQHLWQLLEEQLQGRDRSNLQLHEETVLALKEAYGEANREYCLSRLEKFIRHQKLSHAVQNAQQLMDKDRLDEAENEIEQALRSRLALFSPGITLAEGLAKLSVPVEDDNSFSPIGIPELDQRRIGPTRKELLLYIGAPKTGKTWGLVNTGKQALAQRRWRVLHVTLEMSDERCAQRYLQSLLGITRRVASELTLTLFEKDELGRVIGFDRKTITPKLALDRREDHSAIERKLKRLRLAERLRIVQFPTGSLTVSELRAHLDASERMFKFVPDLIILDYADLMTVDTDNYRHSLDRIYVGLRGLAVERNIALVTASQSNREGAKGRLIRDVNVAEDFRKIATADNVLTLSQTPEERRLGLMRLLVSNARNDEDKFVVLMSQQYAIGQFCRDAVRMQASYENLIASEAARMDGQHLPED